MKPLFSMNVQDRHYTPVSLLIASKQMNKALSTSRSRFIRGLALTLFAVCWSFSFLVAQQTFTTPVNGNISINTLLDCDTTSSFMSDTTTHSLYADSTPRSDTTSICPQNQGQRVRTNFLAFDLAVGDSLFVFDGKIPSAMNYTGSGSGVGVAKAFGGWFTANCDKGINPSGCVSFVFQTNGDNIQSAGFKASVGCLESNFMIQTPRISSPVATCELPYKLVTIPAATILSDCDTLANDTTFVRVMNSSGEICRDTCLSQNANMSFIDTFAFGSYTVEYKLKLDSTITARSFFSVQPRTLVCNDTLNVGMDADCGVVIIPDMLLEGHCEGNDDTILYEITISVPNGKSGGRIIASGTGRAGDYPRVTKDLINYCGDTLYTAEIQRVYYDGGNLSICNDGRQTNKCWTYLRFEDKAAPLFTGDVRCDTVFACNIDMTQNALGLNTPTVLDNCDSVDVVYAGVEMLSVPTECDTIDSYLVLWQATDGCGNISERKDTVKIFRPGVDKIVKAPDVILSCGMDDPSVVNDLTRIGVPGIKIGYTRNGIFIPTDTIPLTSNARICNYNIEYQDTRVQVACNDKYYRYWHLLDWCANSTIPIAIDTQLIEFKDTLAPIIECAEFTTLETAELIDLPSTTCQMEVRFPLPNATDKCVDNPMVKMFTVDVLEKDGWWSVADNLADAGALECDTFRVGYRAFDDCHHEQLKEDTCYRYFIIRDVSAPTAICSDELNVSLGGNRTTLHADAIDGGSWDMCEVDTILARRTLCNNISVYEGDSSAFVINKLGNKIDPIGWSDILTFTCCDVHHPIFAELLVIDKKGNHNTCWMEIKAEDKIPPICQPLPPMTAFCDEYSNGDLGPQTDANENNAFDENEWIPLMGDLEIFYNEKFGDPALVCEDNLDCNNLMMEQEYQLLRQSCGEITIKRRYRVIDYGKNHSAWEEQIIKLEYRANWKINFPVDQAGDCDSKFDIPAESPIQNGNCDQLSWDYEDEFFETSDDVFVKVLRTYSIINWCTYQPGDQPLVIRRPENHQKLVTEPFCISSDSLADVGFIQYTQVMKVVDKDKPFLIMGKVDTILLGKGDAAPHGEEDQTLGAAPFECDAIRVFQVFARDCNEAISENLTYKWECLMDGVMIANGVGDTFSQIVYPGPTYEVKWWVKDAFTNTSLISEEYIFVDGLAPHPYCNNGVVAETTPGNRFVTVSAELFDKGSFDNCTDQADLVKKLWHPVLNTPRPTTAEEVAALPDFLELGCLFIGTQRISFYVMDEAGNFDYCTTNIIIQNNMLACSRRAISGQVMDQQGQPIEAAQIEVESTDANLSLMSDGNGGFEFTMPEGADYTIRPIKNNDPLNGVSTFDLVLISQHILGKRAFDSPYKYIAADVNKSGTITAFDLVHLRQLILNIITELPNNTSWRFVDMDYEFPSKEMGMELTTTQEEKTIRDLSGDRLGMDFLGVKIGDINGSAVPNRSAWAGGRNKTATFSLNVDNQVIEKGKIYTIPFNAEELEQILGYQFTLEFKHLKLLNIQGGVANIEHFGRTMETRGILTTSWHSLLSRETTTALFTLTFQATQAGQLDELLKITSAHTPAEAYGLSGTFLDVSLTFNESSPIPFQVYQNTPNPFNQHTTIAFDLPAKGNVVFQLVNAQGQIVRKREADFQKGNNVFDLDLRSIPEGTYYYQLSTPFGVVTKKMTKVQ